MTQIRFTEEFKQEAIRQVVDRGHPVVEVATRLGVSQHSLYAWLKKYNKPTAATAAEAGFVACKPNCVMSPRSATS